MKREEAVNNLAKLQVNNLTHEERADQLETMLFEGWDEAPEWANLPFEIQNEFESQKLLHNPNSERYDEVLIIWRKDELRAVTNEYLMKELNSKEIEGEPQFFEACPCCGRRTIEERGHYDICTICWWEDNGQDNESADMVSGPNQGTTLTQARYNFLKFGIFEPIRKDLLKIQEDKDKYPVGRVFEISKDGQVIEKGTNWKGNITEVNKKGWLI